MVETQDDVQEIDPGKNDLIYMNIFSSNISENYNRKYLKIYDVLANIGGFLKIITLLIKILYSPFADIDRIRIYLEYGDTYQNSNSNKKMAEKRKVILPINNFEISKIKFENINSFKNIIEPKNFKKDDSKKIIINNDEIINDFSKFNKISIGKSNIKKISSGIKPINPNKNINLITNLKEARLEQFKFYYSEFLINFFPKILCKLKYYKNSVIKKKIFENLKNNFDKNFNFINMIENFTFLDDLKTNIKLNEEKYSIINDSLHYSNLKLKNESI